MGNLFAIMIVAATSVGVVAFGIMSAYAIVIGILNAVSYQPSPQTASLVLLAGEPQASGD